jgi:Flp pilus assembly protein TadG
VTTSVPRRADQGQAAVEVALALPIVALLVLGILQVVVVARDQLAVEVAARDGARAAAVSGAPGTAARSAAERAVSLRPLEVAVSARGDTVTVTVRYRNPTDVALVGAALGPVELVATVTMARDPPPTGR